MDRIYNHKSGATLWQGSIKDVRQLLANPDQRIHVIGLFAQERQPESNGSHYEIVRLGYDDNFYASSAEMDKIAELADKASDIFSDRLRSGKSCLSTCNMGLNRSGLVTALTLMKVTGMLPESAVNTVRENRGPQMGIQPLSNPRFVDLLHKLQPKVGTKSTWTEWRGEI